jgi:hypothetical protein
MATLSTVLTFARAQSQSDSNGLTDTNGIIYANEALVDFHRQLVKKGVDASQLQESYTDGTANKGTYLYPTDMLWLKAIELNYSDTLPQNYRLASQVDVSNLPGGESFSSLRVNADPYNPQFDDRGDWFEIFPTPTGSVSLSQLMRIFYYLKPTEYTSTSDTIAYPESQDIRILGWRIAANYYKSLNKFLEAADFENEYQKRVDDYCSTLARGSQQPIQATPIQVTGFEF